MTIIKILQLIDSTLIITEIEELPSELGEPDCKLINPFKIKKTTNDEVFLESWNSFYTDQNTFMIHSDKILTIINPKQSILEKYQIVTK